MKIGFTPLIAENIAPKGAKQIEIYDSSGTRVGSVPLGNLPPVSKDKLYSVGIVSDVHFAHVDTVAWTPHTKFDNALTYFENQGCLFCCISGDLTQTGFYRRTDENDASTTYLDEIQLMKYKAICDKHTIPIYELSGNHESYYGMSITSNLDKWKTYTGKDVLHYSISQGNDVFIMLGQPHGSTPMTDEALQWLYETLEENRNKRCFVFVHPHISSGNPVGAYSSNQIFDWWGTKTTVFKNLLKHYKNTIVFHGHSHTKFECQEVDSNANYSTTDGFKSVHVPSLGRPRNVVNGTISSYLETESQGYIVDVYDDCIVLNGMDFINNKYVPLGVYKIDTTLQNIEANKFTDNTRTIKI